MPCDTVRTMKLDVGKMDADLATAAIQALGYSNYVRYVNGKLEIPGTMNPDKVTAQVKQAYSAQVVQSQAKRYGWQLKQVGEFKYEVVKR